MNAMTLHEKMIRFETRRKLERTDYRILLNPATYRGLIYRQSGEIVETVPSDDNHQCDYFFGARLLTDERVSKRCVAFQVLRYQKVLSPAILEMIGEGDVETDGFCDGEEGEVTAAGE